MYLFNFFCIVKELLSDKQRLEQQLTEVTEQLGLVEEEKIAMNDSITKHQVSLEYLLILKS